MGADGQRNIVIDKGNDTEEWKMQRDFWDGNSKINDRSGCGVVIKEADKDKWITISKIAVFWCRCTIMTAEVMDVCVLTGILDLVVGKIHSMKNIGKCIDAFVKSH